LTTTASLWLPANALADDPTATDTPNVILIMSDDQGWGDVGFNGNVAIHTPNLDAMAAAGVKFDRFYAAAPLCSPTRGSCMTGRYPFRYGILAAHTSGMRVGEITVAEMLQSKGYRTGFFGKWHIGWVREVDRGSRGIFSPPSHHGFDTHFATTSAVPTYNPTVTPEGWTKWGSKPGEPWKGGAPYVQDGKEVTENMDGDGYSKLKERQQHLYGCITAMDEQIGRLREKLRELKIEKNTVVFFCSDNGPADSLAKKGIASAGPFKGHKHRMYEGGLLVPACAEWPGMIEPKSNVKTRCSTVDFFPTIAKITGYKFKSKNKRPIDGIDLMPVIQGKTDARSQPMFFGYRRLFGEVDGQAIIAGDMKLLRESKPNGRTRLYDLSKDPYEKKDLSEELPEIVTSMKRQMKELDSSCQLSRDGADYKY